ncbi:MAG: alpha-mannosidase [Bacteroidales bacterium]|nr:alpha-mannosidase [Bacteroidales bacterium]
MKLILSLASLFMLNTVLLAQPLKSRSVYDLSKDKVLYTVGYSHLDTEWNWDYPKTIDEYIKNTMTENFYLFEKYPEYVFNFTGSRRYQMMKEYYPGLYEKVKEYIAAGRWYVSGSSVDEGEVNMSSSEALIRQVLYGNLYFKNEFGVESYDYMLPDCFGFLANVPSIWNHCGLLGFSTQKLTWRAATKIPFNVGVWNGPDGKGIIAALNADNYNGGVEKRLDINEKWNERIEKNRKEHGFSFDYRYYGVGDEGGAPRDRDVKNAIGSLNNPDSRFKVVLTSSDQMYKDITPEIRAKLPVYSGDLLLIEHSAGSLTSQAFVKRMNRKNEILAASAEQLASVADWTGLIGYPYSKINNSWELVLGSQFHDILPGTSIPEAYDYAWNDEFIAANGFSNVLESSVRALAGMMNTETKGKPVLVYNPLAFSRDDIVCAEVNFEQIPANVQVFDASGKPVPTQIIEKKNNTLKILFPAKVPSVGLAVYEIREAKKPSAQKQEISVSGNTLENNFYKVTINGTGDIQSIFDKKAGRELLEKPASLQFLAESPNEWPAWNMDWEDRKNPPVGAMNESVSMRIAEDGPVRVSIEIKREGRNSSIVQVVSLSAGEAGKVIEVANKIDWKSQGVSLKAAFPLTVSNKLATYNLGVGTIQRENNTSQKFEVPSKEWFDLTDTDGSYGVTILEDCKYGSDKPADNELRLTLLFTPEPQGNWFPVQKTQDWGIHEFRYGIYGHSGSWQEARSQMQGRKFNQPMLAFEVPAHKGAWGKEASFLLVNNNNVGVMAFKKMENSDYYLVRVNELSGNKISNAEILFAGDILDAYEVNGQEQRIGNASFTGNKVQFDLSNYTIRSFAVKLNNPAVGITIGQQAVQLPFNVDVMSFDVNRHDGNFVHNRSFPAEMVPEKIVSEGIQFITGSKTDEENNAVACKGQEINLPAGNFSSIYILAAASEDTQGEFLVDGKRYQLGIQNWTGYVGQFYNREFAQDGVTVTGMKPAFAKTDNIAWFASHRHQAYPSKNESYRYTYLYKYELNVAPGAKTLKLPDNDRIKILAVTLTNGPGPVKALQPLYDSFTENNQINPGR